MNEFARNFYQRCVSGQGRNNRLDFGDDPDYDPDPIRIVWICMKLRPEVCVGPRTNPLDLGMIRITIRIQDPNYDHYFWLRFAVSD